jgi:hypothetical protein
MASRHQGSALQPLAVKPAEQLDLLRLVAAGHDDRELLGQVRLPPPPFRRRRFEGGAGGGFPGETQFLGDLRHQLLQAGSQLLLRFRQGGQRALRQEQRAGFVLGHVEHLHLDFHGGVEVATQVVPHRRRLKLATFQSAAPSRRRLVAP